MVASTGRTRSGPAGITTNHYAPVGLSARCLVKHGSTDGHALTADGPTNRFLGVATDIDTDADRNGDVIRTGFALVIYGGTVARGQPLTSDANGHAVVAVAGNEVAGYAEVSGAAGDVGSILLGRSVL